MHYISLQFFAYLTYTPILARSVSSLVIEKKNKSLKIAKKWKIICSKNFGRKIF